jgi:CHAT domain-containing protein
MSDTGDRATIKKYLLGEITGEEQLREIEESLFADEKFYEELLRVEAELAEQYARGGLTAAEREKVEDLYLSTPERRRDINFALVVEEFFARKRGGRNSAEPRDDTAEGGEQNAGQDNVRKFLDFKRIFSSAPFKIAASVFIVFALGVVAWRTFIHRSDLDRGLVALNEAYKNQRPTQARISVFSYAPPSNERGGPDKVNGDAKRRAGLFLQSAADDAPSAATYHALGDYLLAAGQFDEALAQFTKASELDPNNARLQNDMGVALLEKAGATGLDDEAGKGLADVGVSLSHFDRALELDGSLPDALFNRALALERLKTFEQAREAWTKYLERDSSSGWADEARRHLERLDERRRGETSQNKEQVFKDFLEAYRLGDDSRAWQVISRNREAITGKLVFTQLIDAYLNYSTEGRDDDARGVLQSLRYAGELELKYAGDSYTADLARYYGLSPPARLAALSEAHEQMRRGFEWCQRAKFGDAARAFESARAAFESAGDESEIYFSDYWIGYSYHQSARSEEASTVLRRLIRVCTQKNYKWLLAQALNSSANVQSVLKNYSDGIAETEQSLTLSEQVGDIYTVQKNLAQQADKYRWLDNRPQMLKYIARCLEQSEAVWPGARQTWRNYDSAANAFQALGLYSAALAYGHEALRLSVEEQDPSTIYVSLSTLGLIYGQLRDHKRGIELARQGLTIGQQLSGTREGRKIVAYCLLQLGHLYRQEGDFVEAVESYEQAIKIYDELEFPVFSYDAHKGKLLCYISLGDDAASWRELQTSLELIEGNRKKIREEQNRNGYYDAEQSVYDIAVDFAYTKFGDPQRAFEYSESSRARSLLDLMRRPPRQPGGDEAPLTIEAVSQPLTLAEIQQRMPERVQILQYTILSDKIVIWLISKERFEAREKKIAADEFGGLVRRYLNLISVPPDGRESEARDAATALYETLLKPVEPLLDGEKLLCIVPDKLLNHLPFESLVSPDNGRYLIADRSVIYSPSSSVFIIGSEKAREKESRASETVLSVGAPAFDQEVFKRLPDLPAAETEARQVKDIYGTGACLVGRAATREAVIRQLGNADIVHFASHYVVSEDSPTSSKLLLAKGDAASEGQGAGDALTVYDLYQMKLQRTRLVVLAACQTGTERYYKGEGMIGMSRAFIAAGVPAVVASQ